LIDPQIVSLAFAAALLTVAPGQDTMLVTLTPLISRPVCTGSLVHHEDTKNTTSCVFVVFVMKVR
jgi:hypothetical protein